MVRVGGGDFEPHMTQVSFADKLHRRFHELPSGFAATRLFQNQEIADLGTSKAPGLLGQIRGIHRPPHVDVTDRCLAIPRCQIGDEAGALPLQAPSVAVAWCPWRFGECAGECRQI